MSDARYRHLVSHSLDTTRNGGNPTAFTRSCADLAVQWLRFHQDSQPNGGVTAHVYFNRGRIRLSPSYPEVTGYIIPSLFNYAKDFGKVEVCEAAIRAAAFGLPLQDE